METEVWISFKMIFKQENSFSHYLCGPGPPLLPRIFQDPPLVEPCIWKQEGTIGEVLVHDELPIKRPVMRVLKPVLKVIQAKHLSVLVNCSFVATGMKHRFKHMKSIHAYPPWCLFSGLFVCLNTYLFYVKLIRPRHFNWFPFIHPSLHARVNQICIFTLVLRMITNLFERLAGNQRAARFTQDLWLVSGVQTVLLLLHLKLSETSESRVWTRRWETPFFPFRWGPWLSYITTVRGTYQTINIFVIYE